MFIGLTSLSAYSFDRQRLSKKKKKKVESKYSEEKLSSLTVLVLFLNQSVGGESSSTAGLRRMDGNISETIFLFLLSL